MRDRKKIEAEVDKLPSEWARFDLRGYKTHAERLILEVLLDIRDELRRRR